jgi:hypothetical protein
VFMAYGYPCGYIKIAISTGIRSVYIHRETTLMGLPKWKKDASEFKVGVYYHPTRGILVTLPKPIAELLGNPKTVTFTVKGKRIEVRASEV